LTTIGLDRPNVVLSNVYPAHQSVNEWFNPMAFAPNSLGTWGNAGRDSLVGPGSFELDLALSRFFPLGEERKLEARWEVFNAINHANFGQPDFTQTDPQFGQLVSAADPRILQFALKFFF
jgi:hypothetical protein